MRNSVLRATLLTAALTQIAGLPAAPPAAAAQLSNPALPELVATLLPSVVNINTTRYKAVQVLPGESVIMQNAESDISRWYGSGFIVTSAGHVLTNKHVVHNTIDIWVTLSDGERLPADLIAEAVCCDIAVIKIRTDKPLPVVKLGDSDALRRGDFVIAIGNPLDYNSTVTAGIISGLNRDEHFTEFDDYIQTDAAINEGNSGGALFNAKGEVIGVNAALATSATSSGNIGIGLAIPINDAKFIVAHMQEIQSGKIRPAYLGAQVQSLTPGLAGAYGVLGPRGSIIQRVLDDGPAAKSGLRAGDIITSFGDKQAKDSRALMRDIVETPAETTVALSILREGKEQTVPVTLTDLPANQSYGTFLGGAGVPKPDIPPAALVNFGLEFAAITPELRAKYRLNAQQQGAVITGVAIGSTAADNGINAGSIVVQVRDTVVTSPDDVLRDFDSERKQKQPFVPMLISEPSGLRWVPLQLSS